MRHVVKGLGLLVVVAALGASGIGVRAAQGTAPTVSKGWVKVPGPGETTALAFAVIDNPTMYDVYLTSAASDVAGKVEFREVAGGGTAEAQAKAFVVVPAYGSVSMDPKGVYLLLMDLKRPLKEADQVSLTFTTDGGATLKASAVVRKE